MVHFDRVSKNQNQNQSNDDGKLQHEITCHGADENPKVKSSKFPNHGKEVQVFWTNLAIFLAKCCPISNIEFTVLHPQYERVVHFDHLLTGR